MKKSFRVENLCCANCAAKIERRIARIADVNAVSLNFMTLKLVIESDTEDWNSLMDEIQAVIQKVEPDCRVVF